MWAELSIKHRINSMAGILMSWMANRISPLNLKAERSGAIGETRIPVDSWNSEKNGTSVTGLDGDAKNQKD